MLHINMFKAVFDELILLLSDYCIQSKQYASFSKRCSAGTTIAPVIVSSYSCDPRINQEPYSEKKRKQSDLNEEHLRLLWLGRYEVIKDSNQCDHTLRRRGPGTRNWLSAGALSAAKRANICFKGLGIHQLSVKSCQNGCGPHLLFSINLNSLEGWNPIHSRIFCLAFYYSNSFLQQHDAMCSKLNRMNDACYY